MTEEDGSLSKPRLVCYGNEPYAIAMAKYIAILISLTCLFYSLAGNAQSVPGQPPNSYVIGAQWHCNSGYRKQENRCVSIFDEIGGRPSNSYTIGAQWHCNSGYRKQENRCVSIF